MRKYKDCLFLLSLQIALSERWRAMPSAKCQVQLPSSQELERGGLTKSVCLRDRMSVCVTECLPEIYYERPNFWRRALMVFVIHEREDMLLMILQPDSQIVAIMHPSSMHHYTITVGLLPNNRISFLILPFLVFQSKPGAQQRNHGGI